MISRVKISTPTIKVKNHTEFLARLEEGFFIDQLSLDDQKERQKLYKRISINVKYKNEHAWCLINAYGIRRNINKAVVILDKQKDSMYAKYILGWLYASGLNGEIDYQAAIKYLIEASDGNIKQATYLLSDILVSEDINSELGFHYTKLSAFDGLIKYRNVLAYLYYIGYGVEKNYDKAFYLLKENAESNNDDTLYNLGFCYYNGIGVSIDYQRAYYYFKQSSNMGNIEAIKKLAHMFEFALGVDRDYKKVFDYYFILLQVTADKDYYNKIGMLYNLGYGVQKDIDNAILYYKEAIKRKSIEAVYNLGLCYISLGQDKLGLKMIKKAENLGHLEAKEYLQMENKKIHKK